MLNCVTLICVRFPRKEIIQTPAAVRIHHQFMINVKTRVFALLFLSRLCTCQMRHLKTEWKWGKHLFCVTEGLTTTGGVHRNSNVTSLLPRMISVTTLFSYVHKRIYQIVIINSLEFYSQWFLSVVTSRSSISKLSKTNKEKIHKIIYLCFVLHVTFMYYFIFSTNIFISHSHTTHHTIG